MSMDKIAKDQQQVFSKMQDYSTAYTNYMMCNSKIPETLAKAKKMGICKAATKIPPDINDLNESLSALGVNVTKLINSDTNIPTDKDNDKSQEELKERYNQVLEMRSDLDLKLNELADTKSSISSEMGMKFDSTVYANMLWTILATSLLYVIFVKL
jgi:hypothetical protein